MGDEKCLVLIAFQVHLWGGVHDRAGVRGDTQTVCADRSQPLLTDGKQNPICRGQAPVEHLIMGVTFVALETGASWPPYFFSGPSSLKSPLV